MENLNKMSVQQLRELSERARKIANDLEEELPSYELALETGIEDNGYNTTANGYVSSYSGEVVITMADGRKFKAIGHRPRGDAWSIYRQGYIEFIPLSMEG